MRKIVRAGGKPSRTRPLPAVGAQPTMSAMVGGVGNANSPPATKPGTGMAFNKGGIAAHVEGGFKNRGMANRR